MWFYDFKLIKNKQMVGISTVQTLQLWAYVKTNKCQALGLSRGDFQRSQLRRSFICATYALPTTPRPVWE